MNLHPSYITNETGQRVSAVLPIEEYQALLDRMEELEDLAEARSSPTPPLGNVNCAKTLRSRS